MTLLQDRAIAIDAEDGPEDDDEPNMGFPQPRGT